MAEAKMNISIPTVQCVFCLTQPENRPSYRYSEPVYEVNQAVTVLEGNAICSDHLHSGIDGLRSGSKYGEMYRAIFGLWDGS